MNDEEIRIAIAEACGANPFREEEYPHRTMWTFGEIGSGEPCYTIYDLPDYPNDLNAMHEAEKGLTDEQWNKYTDYLCEVTNPDWDSYRSTAHATARQRAEAFLRTIGKWRD